METAQDAAEVLGMEGYFVGVEEDLEEESNNMIFADRVRAVVERAVEVTAPLWG